MYLSKNLSISSRLFIYFILFFNMFIYFAAAAAKSLQSCPTLCNHMNCSLPGSSIHGIFWATVLEWGCLLPLKSLDAAKGRLSDLEQSTSSDYSFSIFRVLFTTKNFFIIITGF